MAATSQLPKNRGKQNETKLAIVALCVLLVATAGVTVVTARQNQGGNSQGGNNQNGNSQGGNTQAFAVYFAHDGAGDGWVLQYPSVGKMILNTRTGQWTLTSNAPEGSYILTVLPKPSTSVPLSNNLVITVGSDGTVSPNSEIWPTTTDLTYSYTLATLVSELRAGGHIILVPLALFPWVA